LRTRFHGDAAIGDGILQGDRPDTGLRARVTNESRDFLILDVKAHDSSVIPRCLGVQDIVRKRFQELSSEFAQVPDGLHLSRGIDIGAMNHLDSAIFRESHRFDALEFLKYRSCTKARSVPLHQCVK
jgi:hypothetical protein